jgi:uncharacterized protein involved in exopolysaccharide biosynthesis
MTAGTLEALQSGESRRESDEIDLRQSLKVLIAWRREIVLFTLAVALLAILVVLVLRWLLPKVYQASADVAIVRMVSDISFDERFVTTADKLGEDTSSNTARRNALLGLVASGGIASIVSDELGGLLTEDERSPSNLLELVSAELGLIRGAQGSSDLIKISVRANNPDKAAAIANAWAKAYVSEVNTVYGQVPNEVLDSIQVELAVAEKTYNEEQKNLESFLTDNQTKEWTSLLSVLQQRIDQEVSLQQANLNQWQELTEYLSAARTLQAQLEQGGLGAARSSMVALQTLKLQVYGKPSEKVQLELRDLPELSAEEVLTDVRGLIISLEKSLIDLDAEILKRSDNLRTTDKDATDSFAPLYTEIRQLQTRIEKENARKNQLELRRNLAWEAYKALSNKVAELNLTRAASSSEVRFVANAVASKEPVNHVSGLLALIAGGLAGLFLSVFYVFIADYIGQKPFLTN